MWRPMSTAPKTGEPVIINTFTGPVEAYYLDCAWLREPNPFLDLLTDDTEIEDCWRPVCLEDHGDIELSDAIGWRPNT